MLDGRDRREAHLVGMTVVGIDDQTPPIVFFGLATGDVDHMEM